MSHLLYQEHIESNFQNFQPNDIGIMRGKLTYDIYKELSVVTKAFLASKDKILINPEDENISGDKRSEIESYFFNKELIFNDLKCLLYNYYLYYFVKHGVVDPLVNRVDNLRFDVKMSVLNMLKPNQFKYFNYAKYPYQFLICLDSPEDIFFRDSLKNGRISCINSLFLKRTPVDPSNSTNIYLNDYYQTIDFLPKPGDLFFFCLKNHSFIQYPIFNIDNTLNNKYIYLSIYLN